MATLYVRNLPPELYAELQQWAAEAGRSVNAEVLDLLEREVASRKARAEWWQKLQALREQLQPLGGAPWPEDLIREDRDRGHRPDQGF